MADRSDEATRTGDSRSTEDLLEETEDLLAGDPGAATETGAGAGPNHSGGDADPDVDSGGSPSSRRWVPKRLSPRRLWRAATGGDGTSASRRSRLSVGRYVSPRSFLVVALALAAGLLAGGTFVPIAGRIVGLFAVAFLLGAATSTRRYLEVALAGAVVGAVSAVFDHVMVTIGGSARIVLAVGAGAALSTAAVGYYFGRDLRNGLTRDVEGGR